MIRFIWRNWWRKKERLFLLLVGVLIISLGLAYLVGLSESNKGTIVNELEQRWASSYDIVVRPEESRSITEKDDLLDPNFLSGIYGGISIEQYEKIKQIPNVEIAAPISMIGYVLYSINLESLELEEDGIYRLVSQEIIDDGIRKHTNTVQSYFPFGEWVPFVLEKFKENPRYYLGFPYEHLTAYRYLLLAAIDPEQEAKLVGLDQAIMSTGKSRYFTKDDKVRIEPLSKEEDNQAGENPHTLISYPVIINNHSYADQRLQWQIERLNITLDRETANETLDRLENLGGEEYLNTLEGKTVATYTFNEQEIYSHFVNSIAGYDRITGEPVEEDYINVDPWSISYLPFPIPPTPLMYESIQSPFEERWQHTYKLQTFTMEGLTTFRKPVEYQLSEEEVTYTFIKPRWIGYYDPSQLNLALDPLTELPMETYRPATAELVLDADQKPINPPRELKPTYNPYGYLANPPTMLTTLEAAEHLVGKKPISAIRIKVAGVSDLSEESQALLEQVATEIEEKTGLITDITLGSSPQQNLINVPELKSESMVIKELGWFQQPWIKLGSSFSIFRETKIGFSGLILSIISVAAIYVWATSLVSLFSRRKEFAVLLAVGWSPRQLSRLLFTESVILGLIATLIAWLMLGFITISEGTNMELYKIVLTGFVGFLIYILGAIVPSLLVRKIEPYEAMQTGEITKTSSRFVRTRGIISLAFNHFIGKWKRSILSILTIALPTSLLAVFLFISFRLQGTMYMSILGEYIALEVGPAHYTAIIVALVIAILTTAEIQWQNVAERQEEISLLKAIGWKNNSIRFMIWSEGIITGLLAAILGLTCAFFIQWLMYGEVLIDTLKFVLATGIVPIAIGLIGTILPAERAARISPIHGLVGRFRVRKGLEKILIAILILSFIIILGILVYMFVQIM